MVSGRNWALVALVVLVLGATGVAQSLYGSLVGTVTDESGAAVPGATVTVTQVETNASRSVVTNEAGSYNVPNLLPGTYEIVVSLPGFQTSRTRDVAVRQGLDLRLDARLKLGAIEESVTVSGQAAVLQTESAAVQSLTTKTQLETLPTSGRAYQTATSRAVSSS